MVVVKSRKQLRHEQGLGNQKVTQENGELPAGGDPYLLPIHYLAAANR